MSRARDRYADRLSSPRAERRKAARTQGSHRRHAPQRASVWRGPFPFVVSGLAIAVAIGWSVLSSRAAPAVPTPAAGPATAAIISSVTSVPSDVLDKVGAGSVSDPLRPTSLDLLRGPSGKPLVIYAGTEYCPYCASERWSLIVALSRFGTFHGLTLTRSSSTDVFPDTPTFSFRGSNYASEVIELSAVEMADRAGGPLDSPTPVLQASYVRSDPQGSIPYVSIADRYVAVGSGFPPDVLRARSWSDIATQLSDPAGPVARAVLGNANWITAAICRTIGNASAVCTTPAVRALPTPEP